MSTKSEAVGVDPSVAFATELLGFAAEALRSTGRRVVLPSDPLHGHPALQPFVEGEEHLPHATLPQATLQPVRPDPLAH